jgi:NAD(P) transhydrogenase subunit beta
MAIAVASQLVELGTVDYRYILAGVAVGASIGAVLAVKVEMTAMPQLVAIFNGFGGAASLLVGLSLFAGVQGRGTLSSVMIGSTSGLGTGLTLLLSIVIGAVTFSGSILAYLKLSDRYGSIFGKSILLPQRHLITLGLLSFVLALSVALLTFFSNPVVSTFAVLCVALSALLLGFAVVLPIGGADMPVVVSLLNSYSGLAASATGFALNSPVLIVSGALVGASGLILTQIMCKGMNRSLANVMIGGFGGDTADASASGDATAYVNVKSSDVEESALTFESARDVIIVPGYGLAVAQGQSAVAEFASHLKALGARVRYAIHPVAGRMPGHMNVLLAESNVPYDELFEMDEINSDFRSCDIVLVVGANDVVNPAAKTDSTSPLFGMPILNVDQAPIVYVIKRSLSPGFAGVKNDLFDLDNCRMIFGDAKKVLEELSVYLDVAKAA